YTYVESVPVIASLTDDNGDGLINELDVADIAFNSMGPLRVISGEDGHELFTVTNGYDFFERYSNIAAGDIDNDGIAEIVGYQRGISTSCLLAFEHDGTLKWKTQPFEGITQRWAVSIADIDHDGNAEIISGHVVFNNDGTLRWSGTARYDGISIVTDLDMDGYPEILVDNTAYRNDGTVYWKTPVITSPLVGHAVANLDDDPYPEIIQTIKSSDKKVTVYCFEHDGVLKWGPIKLVYGDPAAAAIGDFDGDGKPEIGISAGSRYTVLRADGSIMWESVVFDGTGGGLGASIFDFDGNGAAEIVHNDNHYLRIFDGTTGEVLFSTPNSTLTAYEYPSIADVDNDGSTEIIVYANPSGYYNYKGIRVFENRCDSWRDTRKIWNEYNY
ncbi:MAG: FG-GAP repeat domain-containing protein, partial [Candidatus Zixiibacteriota bacterium]